MGHVVNIPKNKKTPGTGRLRVSHPYLSVSRRFWHLTLARRLSGFTGPVPSAALDKHGIQFVAGDIVAPPGGIVKKKVELFTRCAENFSVPLRRFALQQLDGPAGAQAVGPCPLYPSDAAAAPLPVRLLLARLSPPQVCRHND